jgi:hypothetical protein
MSTYFSSVMAYMGSKSKTPEHGIPWVRKSAGLWLSVPLYLYLWRRRKKALMATHETYKKF